VPEFSVFEADTLYQAVTLTFDLLTLNFYSTSDVLRLNSTKFERNRIIHGRVIHDLARFRRAILGVAQLTEISQGCVYPTSPNLARTWGDHRSIALLFFKSSDILLHFQTRAAQS